MTTSIEGKNPFLVHGDKSRRKKKAEKIAARIVDSLKRKFPGSVIVVSIPSDTCPCVGRASCCSCNCD